ncbi:MAG TPA: FAD/NAD(P)-binding protein [Ktedonobacterales bacterium]|jgi:NAD(P)H-flavin reductase
MSAIRANPMAPDPWRIERIRRETPDTFTMELGPVVGETTRPFAAGQFNMLYVFGVGEVPISISGDPTRGTSLVHTVRAVGAVTRVMCALKRHDVLGVRGPFGSQWPLREAEGLDVVMVAGGLGLAPLRPAIYQILARRTQYGRVALLYGARTPADLLYRRELYRWGARADMDVQVTVDRGDNAWRGNVGVVPRFIATAQFDPLDTMALVCGPEIMMHFTLLELQKRGLTAEQIFLSLERNMKCALGFCGHCQFGPFFECKDGPVFRYDTIQRWFGKREV